MKGISVCLVNTHWWGGFQTRPYESGNGQRKGDGAKMSRDSSGGGMPAEVVAALTRGEKIEAINLLEFVLVARLLL